jgi:hypothetical protein
MNCKFAILNGGKTDFFEFCRLAIWLFSVLYKEGSPVHGYNVEKQGKGKVSLFSCGNMKMNVVYYRV